MPHIRFELARLACAGFGLGAGLLLAAPAASPEFGRRFLGHDIAGASLQAPLRALALVTTRKPGCGATPPASALSPYGELTPAASAPPACATEASSCPPATTGREPRDCL